MTAGRPRERPPGFEGVILHPGDAGYDEKRLVYDRRADRKPASIARCASVRDVALALDMARSSGLPIAVRSCGHGFTGRSTIDGGVLIDLSRLDHVALDEGRRTVRVGPGARTGRVLAETVPRGFAPVTCAGSDVGVLGAALFAGQGFLSPRFGNMCDNVLSLDLMRRDGAVVTVSAAENPDLFWAMRGAGDNFGIVTSIEMRVHPVPALVLACTIEYDAADAAAIMRSYRDRRWASPLPWVLGSLFLDPETDQPRLSYLFALTGSDEAARRDLDAIAGFGAPVSSSVERVDWAALHDQLVFPGGQRFYIAQRELHALDDESIALMLAQLAALVGDPARSRPVEGTPGAMILFYATDAAMGEMPDPPNAYGLRGGYDLEAVAIWGDPALDAHHEAWAEGVVAAAVAAGRATKPSVLANSTVDAALTEACFGEDIARLAALKRIHDPEGIFGSTAIIRREHA